MCRIDLSIEEKGLSHGSVFNKLRRKREREIDLLHILNIGTFIGFYAKTNFG